jgi:very-short-patch-repair endonuclease
MQPWKRAEARRMRANPTPAERCLWDALKGRQLMGLRFRRQHRIFGYIADFYCATAELAVEVDGQIHAKRQPYDQGRDSNLAKRGIAVIRFTNKQVLTELPWVLENIAAACPLPTTEAA